MKESTRKTLIAVCLAWLKLMGFAALFMLGQAIASIAPDLEPWLRLTFRVCAGLTVVAVALYLQFSKTSD